MEASNLVPEDSLGRLKGVSQTVLGPGRRPRLSNILSPSALALVGAFCAPIHVGRAASELVSDAKNDVKSHTLFMGADFSVERGGDYYPVTDVRGSSFIINVKGASIEIPMDLRATNLRVQSSLKLTETAATIADLKGERSYTWGADPVRIFTKATVDSAYQNSDAEMAADDDEQKVDIAQAEVDRGSSGSSGAKASPGIASSAPGPISSAEAAQILAVDTTELSQVRAAQIMPEENMGTPLGRDQFDAMEVEFNVSAGKALTSPFIVMVTRIHEKGAPPKISRNQIYARSLNPIGAKPARIHILAGGFPPGFELIGYQIRLYNDGLEVATNVSSKRVALSRDEAFEYVKLEYVAAHRGETLPASPAMGHLPGDLPGRLGAGMFKRTYYVKVSKEGLPVGAYLDGACSKTADDPYLESVIQNIRFNPALKNGNPIDGVAALRLGELTA
jgi:hypothetical protein